MAIQAGETVTAARLNQLRPKPYVARASSTVTGIVVDTDIPGASVTLTTETPGATYIATGTFDMDWEGATAAGSVIIGKLDLDGVIQPGEAHAERAAGALGDRWTVPQFWQGTIPAAGSHTLKLKVSIPDADQRVTLTHTAIQVTIYEVV